ncbi:MAG: transporter substrate-binding domain-containing protein, partial [Lysobacteraceae bacterium]
MGQHSNSVARRACIGLALVAALSSLLPAAPAQAADLLADARARGTLRIAMEGTYPPFNFRDPKSGRLSGYDVDVANLVAGKLGLKPELITTEWAAILAGLAAGKYDVIVSQVGITARREQAFDFSRPYTYSFPQLIVRKNDRANYGSLADLKGKTVGV